jgi:hypothetical protein
VDVLTAILVELIVIAVLFEIARRASLPYPALFVLGGLVVALVSDHDARCLEGRLRSRACSMPWPFP